MIAENNTINILVAGLTGSGKSTLIKAVSNRCQGKNNAIRIWDSVGLELNLGRNEEAIKSIIDNIKDFDQIHVI